MKKHETLKLLMLTIFPLASPCVGFAQEEKPCLIFYGSSENTENLSLEEYNKISFSDNFFIISPLDDQSSEDVVLPYSEFNKLRYGIAVPTISEVEKLLEDPAAFIRYSKNEETINLESPVGEIHEIYLFNVDGRLLMQCSISCEKPVSVRHLSSGIYIAAIKESSKIGAIKFVK